MLKDCVGPCASESGRISGGGVVWCLNADATSVWMCVSGGVSPAFIKPSALTAVEGHQVLYRTCNDAGGGTRPTEPPAAGAGEGNGRTTPPDTTPPAALSLPPPCACASAFASGSEGAFLTISVLNLVIVAVNLGCTLPASPG